MMMAGGTHLGPKALISSDVMGWSRITCEVCNNSGVLKCLETFPRLSQKAESKLVVGSSQIFLGHVKLLG